MSVRVGFLRAVNLGGRRVPMTRLVAVCEGLGYADVWTYVNSGNVVFDTTGAGASVEAAMQMARATALAVVEALQNECRFSVNYAGRDLKSVKGFDGSEIGAKEDIEALRGQAGISLCCIPND